MTLAGNSSLSSRGKVLLTGGTGFVASHILDCLLDHGFDVVTTVRSEDKGRRIIESIDGPLKKHISFVVVENVAAPSAFDQAVKSEPPFDYVVHTASPYQLRFDRPTDQCLDPAIGGTRGILNAVNKYAPAVKRVVITSSSAAILSPPNHPEVYDESCWSDVTWDDALDPEQAYRASKKFSEKAAWDFMAAQNPSFTLATICNTYTFGPLPRSLDSLDRINTSNKRLLDMVTGGMRHGVHPTAPVFTFVDARDVALAHVRAMTVPEAAGKRFYVVGGFFSNPRLVEIVRDKFPRLEKEGKLPPREQVVDDFPEGHWRFDNRRSMEILGLQYTGLEKCVADAVESILARV